MKVAKVHEDGQTLTVSFDGVTFGQMNTLRRLMMSEVPVMAVELVEFTKNSSILYDEMIALRLGLVPLTTDLKGYQLPSDEEKTSGEYGAKSSVKGTLTAKGPCVVYAKDLTFKDPKVKPVYPEMPIVKLLEGQELELVATAVLGLGKEHAKWSPCLASYRQQPSITIGKNVDAKRVTETLKEVNLTALTLKGGKLAVNEQQLLLDDHPDAYEDLDPGITVNFAEDAFLLTVESWGQLDPRTIMSTAVERSQGYLKEFDSLI